MKRLLSLVLMFALLLSLAPGVSAIDHDRLTRQQAVDPPYEMPTDQIILKYRSADMAQRLLTAPADELRRMSTAAGVPLRYVRPMSEDTHVLRLPERRAVAEVRKIADRLAELPGVGYSEPDRILRPLLVPNDAQYASQWHYFDTYGIDAPAAWDITTGSPDIVVAVIDTGILNHGDLLGRTVPGYDFIHDPAVANDGDGRDSNPADPGDWVAPNECGVGSPAESSSWHGTHVAGTIGAASNNSLGVAGINWVSKILPVRVLGKCGGYDSDIIDGMKWAAGLSVPGVPANPNPAKVLNLSFGGPGACDTTQQNAINAIVAAGATIVVAAGNSNVDAAGFSPANCNNVIAVAATNRSGNRAYYSNFGAVVDIAAPGGETNVTSADGILSTLNSGTTSPGADAFAFYQGTSMATPHVAGVASLVVSLLPSLTPAQVQQILQATIKPFPGGSTCNVSICGSGIVSAFNAVNGLPRITSYSPASINAGSISVTLVITGANLINGSIVKWNGLNLDTTFVDSTQLTAIVSSSLLTTAGVGNINVTGVHATYGSLTTAAQRVAILGAQQVFLPLVGNNYPLIPAVPVLLAINNLGNANAYTVVWNGSSFATSYTLQEDDNATFGSPITAYSGAGTSLAVSNKPAGTYYYRVRASNANGASGWSGTQATTVANTSNLPLAGFWDSGMGDEFYVTSDRQFVDDFAIYLSVQGCGSYKITHTTAVPIANLQFSFSGAFYASGTFNSTTSANGVDGLTNFNISGCGSISGGPWNYTATWQHAALNADTIVTPITVVGEDGITRTTLAAVTHVGHRALYISPTP